MKRTSYERSALGHWIRLASVSLTLALPGPALAGMLDSPLPTFSDGKPAFRVGLLPTLISNNNVESHVICTNLTSSPVNIGVEVFNSAGSLVTSIPADDGVFLNVPVGATVSLGTVATPLLAEQLIFPSLPVIANGTGRIVASRLGVACSASLVDRLHAIIDPAFGTSPPPTFVRVPVWSCGNSVVDPFEQCDDANTESGDGCSAVCQLESVSVPLAPPGGLLLFMGLLLVTSAGLIRRRKMSKIATTLGAASLLALSFAYVGPAHAGPNDTPLPTFSNGATALHVYTAVGVIKNNNVETVFICTNTGSGPVHIGVEVFDKDGGLGNTIAAGNGEILNVPVGATVTFATSGTALISHNERLTALPSLRNGSGRILASSKGITCIAMVLDELHEVFDPMFTISPPPPVINLPLIRRP
ncbi:MAG: myxococcus cysteine-rich repeat containing protein [Myxococcota bacterium]